MPEVHTDVPGPRSRALAKRIEQSEAPGINTLYRGQPSVIWKEALGSNVLDVDGNRFIDLTSGFGVASIGHRHPAVVQAVNEQTERLVHGLGDVHSHELRIELAERLCELSPVEDPRVYFAVSGADAVEIALKSAVLATGRKRFLAFDPAYHGLSLGALRATSRPEFREPFLDASHDVTRLPFACAPSSIDAQLNQSTEQDRYAAAIVEPVIGREGVRFPPRGWISELAELCRQHSVALIADEVFTGFWRTGPRFAVDHESVKPDALCCGKALAGGLPIGTTLLSPKLAQAWSSDSEARHTGTFVANPLACAAANAALGVLEEQRGFAHEELMRATLEEAIAESGATLAGRGGLFALQPPSHGIAQQWQERLLSRGIITLKSGSRPESLQLCPPFCTTTEQTRTLAEELASVCKQGNVN